MPLGNFSIYRNCFDHVRGFAVAAVLLLSVPCIHAEFFIEATPIQYASPLQYALGQSITLQPYSRGGLNSPPEASEYQWMHDNTPIPGATGTSVSLANLSTADGGNYRLRFTTANSVSFSNTLTINIGPLPVSPIDPAFSLPLSAGSTLAAVGVDGSIFVRTLGAESPSKLLRFDPDGTPDLGFALPTTIAHPNAVQIVATFPDGGLIISEPPFRLNRDGSPGTLVLPPDFNATESIVVGAVQTDGKFLLGQRNRLIRFNPDGSVDTSFSYVQPAPLDTLGMHGGDLVSIESLEPDSLGRNYVTYRIVASQVRVGTPSRMVTLRLLCNGIEDLSFNRQDPGFSSFSPQHGQVYRLGNGRLFRAGYDSDPAMLHEDGTLDPSWTGYTKGSIVMVDRLRNRIYASDYVSISGYSITAASLTQDFLTPIDGQFYVPQLGSDGNLFTEVVPGYGTGKTDSIERLRTASTVIPPLATISAGSGIYPHRHDSVTVSSVHQVWGTGPFSLQWLALDGQPLAGDTTRSELPISDFDVQNFGRYQLRVTSPQGISVLSNVIEYSLGTTPHLTNLSGRAWVGTGEKSAIGGFVVGSDSQGMLLRGVGPALKPFGVTQFLPDPVIVLHDSTGGVNLTNDNWGGSVTNNSFARYGAFPFADGSRDAGGETSTGRGVFSLNLFDQSGATGVGLLEIYAPSFFDSPLINLSFRAHTEPGENIAIAGFITVDPQGFDRPAKVLLRAIGPTLGSYGIQHPLTNPILTVYNSEGEVIATNDDWAVANSSADAATLNAAMKQVGAFCLTADSKDSALLLDLPAGAYTMQATGGSGVVLLEVYLVR